VFTFTQSGLGEAWTNLCSYFTNQTAFLLVENQYDHPETTEKYTQNTKNRPKLPQAGSPRPQNKSRLYSSFIQQENVDVFSLGTNTEHADFTKCANAFRLFLFTYAYEYLSSLVTLTFALQIVDHQERYA
jgi:hypothetical protein